MVIEWPLVILLLIVSIPGIVLVIPRFIEFVLQKAPPTQKKRITWFAVGQTLLMVFIMALVGSILSTHTKLNAPILTAWVEGKPEFSLLLDSFWSVFLYSLGGLFVFLILYERLAVKVLDQQTLSIMNTMRHRLGLDGCIYYSVAEEILARWGLMNLLVFFTLLFIGSLPPFFFWLALLLSGVLYSFSQIPAYIAAGCIASRPFYYVFILLSLWQAVIFGLVFWRFGLLMAILAHMLFHIGWWLHSKFLKSEA